MHNALVGIIGRTDVAASLASVGPFPADLPFPEDAVLAELSVDETNITVQLEDPDVRRPISNMVSGTAFTRVPIEELQAFYTAGLPAVGWEVSSSGFNTSTQGDGTVVVSALFNRPGQGFDGDVTENLSMTLVSRPDDGYQSAELNYSRDEEAEAPYSPISAISTGFPAPADFRLSTSRARVFYFGSPSLSYSFNYSNPGDAYREALQSVFDSLPAGPYDRNDGAEIAGDDDLPSLNITYADLGDGSVASTESTSGTRLSVDLSVDFPLPASLEPFLLG